MHITIPSFGTSWKGFFCPSCIYLSGLARAQVLQETSAAHKTLNFDVRTPGSWQIGYTDRILKTCLPEDELVYLIIDWLPHHAGSATHSTHNVAAASSLTMRRHAAAVPFGNPPRLIVKMMVCIPITGAAQLLKVSGQGGLNACLLRLIGPQI